MTPRFEKDLVSGEWWELRNGRKFTRAEENIHPTGVRLGEQHCPTCTCHLHQDAKPS